VRTQRCNLPFLRHTPPRNTMSRSPGNGAPTRRGSRAALPWAALQLGVEVNYHPPTARAPLASHPRTTLHVEHTPLKAQQAGALLVGTRSRSGHELMQYVRRCRGRGSRLCCGCCLASRSCVPTADNLHVPRRSSPPVADSGLPAGGCGRSRQQRRGA
jgi:hypothetical protein